MNAVTTTLNQVLASSPLRHAPFRTFYMASVGVALGYTMQATMAAWLMAVMTPSEVMVALVQTASTAPAILFGLVAGALSDIVERRHVILATQIVFLVGTLILGIATLFGVMAPWALLVLTFVIGIGFTFYMPAQQASINELVERPDVPKAVALGAVAMNVSRAIGPAIAGALTAVGRVRQCVSRERGVLRRHDLRRALVAGAAARAARRARIAADGHRQRPALRAPLVADARDRAAQLHVRAVRELALRAAAGHRARPAASRRRRIRRCCSASFGAGAVVAALNIPRALGKHSLQRMVLAASLLWVISATLVAATEHMPLAMVGTFGAGASWVGRVREPRRGDAKRGARMGARACRRDELRDGAGRACRRQRAVGRGGVLAGHARGAARGRRHVPRAARAASPRARAPRRATRTSCSSDQVPALGISDEPEPEDGPVLIQIEYRIDPANRDAFLRAVRAIGPVRRRNGANSWRVFRDLAEDGLFVERYIISSWAEYVRQRSRMTVADRHIQQEIEKHQREGRARARVAIPGRRPARGGARSSCAK